MTKPRIQNDRLRMVSNIKMGLNQINFNYKNRDIQYVKGGKFIKATDEFGDTLNIRADYLNQTEGFILTTFEYEYQDLIIETILNHLVIFRHYQKKDKASWGKFFVMHHRDSEGKEIIRNIDRMEKRNNWTSGVSI